MADLPDEIRIARLHGWLVAKGLVVEGDESLAELQEAAKSVACAEFLAQFA